MVPTTTNTVSLIENCQYTQLFNRMGWSWGRYKGTLKVNRAEYSYQQVAHMCGVGVFSFQVKETPDLKTREKIQQALQNICFENLVIFHTENSREQIWSYRKSNDGRLVEIGDTDFLVTVAEKCSFTLKECSTVTLMDVVKRLHETFASSN